MTRVEKSLVEDALKHTASFDCLKLALELVCETKMASEPMCSDGYNVALKLVKIAWETFTLNLVEGYSFLSVKDKIFIGRQEEMPVVILERLSTDESQHVRSSVALNPSASVAILEKLSTDESFVRECVAQNPSTPAAILEKLSTDEDFWVKRSAAKNPSTPAAALEKLSTDENEIVRYNVARNPSTPVAIAVARPGF